MGDELTFEEAAKNATAFESAENETRNIQPATAVHTIRRNVPLQNTKYTATRGPSVNFRNTNNNMECTRCGGNHLSDNCFKKSWTCYNCQRQGHIATKCHFRQTRGRNMVRQLDEQDMKQEEQAEYKETNEEIILGSIQMVAGEDEAAWMPL